MFARKRRETTCPKLFTCQEQENDEAKIVESCNFKEEFEFSLADIKNWESFVHFMYRPMDPASLGLIRIMFGMYDTMLLVMIHHKGLKVPVISEASVKFHTIKSDNIKKSVNMST
jgi:hypothetical protein